MSKTRALPCFVQVSIFGSALVLGANFSFAASANSQPPPNSSIVKPGEQMAKPVIQLPVETKGTPSKSSAGSAGLVSSQAGTQSSSKPGVSEQVPLLISKGSMVNHDQDRAGGVGGIQTNAAGMIGLKPPSPVPTTVDPDGSVDELERRVRRVLEGKIGTDGEVLLKLSAPDGSASQGFAGAVTPKAEANVSGGRKVSGSGVPPDFSVQGTRASAGHRVHGGKWSWEGRTGPSDWGRMDPEFVACSNGRFQAPIKIPKAGALDNSVHKPEFHFKSSSISIGYINGILTIDTLGTSSVHFRGESWSLDRIQIYARPLTVFEAVEAEGAFLFIFKGKGAALYIDVPYKASPNAPINLGLQRFLQRVPLNSDDGPRFSDVEWNPLDLLGTISSEMYFYAGSQPHPPCKEGGFWIAFARPVELSKQQFADLKQFVPRGGRPGQPINDRAILRLSSARH